MLPVLPPYPGSCTVSAPQKSAYSLLLNIWCMQMIANLNLLKCKCKMYVCMYKHLVCTKPRIILLWRNPSQTSHYYSRQGDRLKVWWQLLKDAAEIPQQLKKIINHPFLYQGGTATGRTQTEHAMFKPAMETKWAFAPLGFCLVGWGILNRNFNNYHSRPLSHVPLQVSWSPFGHWRALRSPWSLLFTLEISALNLVSAQSLWPSVVSDIEKCW